MIYGQFNNNLEKIYSLISNNDVILKFLYYKQDGIDILQSPNLNSTQRKEVKKRQILKHKKIVSNNDAADCYISLEYLITDRSDSKARDRNAVQKQWVRSEIGVWITVADSLLDTENGNRVMALEYAIQECMTGQNVEGLGTCYLSNGLVDRTVDGYSSRLIPLRFFDKNESGF